VAVVGDRKITLDDRVELVAEEGRTGFLVIVEETLDGSIETMSILLIFHGKIQN
jgi:hypothetical protein